MFRNKSSTQHWKLCTLHLAIIAWVFKSPAGQYGEEAGDGAYSLSSSSEKKTRMSLETFADVIAKVEHSPEWTWSSLGLKPSSHIMAVQCSPTWAYQVAVVLLPNQVFYSPSDSSSDVLKLLFDDNHALEKLQVSNIQEENAFENSSYYL